MMVRNGLLCFVVMSCCVFAFADEAPPVPENVLFLTTSQAFAHSPVVEKDGEPSLAERVLRPLFEEMGATLKVTKDASTINAENLKNYDLVMFYTQGDLTQPNLEEAPVMGPNGQAELIEWIENGGRFLGFHSATDTFDLEGPEVSPYIAMIGAEFATHGRQFTGKIIATDPEHPAMANIPDGWELHEEWYLFRKFNEDAIRVLALVDPGEERARQPMYNIPPYPVIWVRTQGQGRVYYTALGHREDVWESERFQKSVVDAVHWLMSTDDPRAEPNFAEVVPSTMPEEGSGG